MPILLLLLYFFSGLASLIYEVTWLKLLAGSLSNSSHALSLVLAGFLLGLAIGSRECGRHGSSIVRPIAAYAWLEVCVAVIAVGMPFLLRFVSEAALSFLPADFAQGVRLVGCGVLVLVATIPIGATFPLQIRAFDPSPSTALRAASFILGFQTAGGMTGVLLSGFLLLPAFGIQATHFLAVSITSLVAAAALVLSAREPRRPAETPLPEVGGMVTFDRSKYRALCIALGVVGGASLALEVLYTRILAFFLPDVAFSFSAVLAVYLFAIAVGASFSVTLARRVSGLTGAGVLAVAGGVLAIGSLAMVRFLYPVMHSFEAPQGGFDPGSFTLAAMLASGLLLLLPAAVMAAFLPLGIGLLAPGHGTAPSAGAAFSANSIGSSIGALAAGMLLVPWLGIKVSVLVVGSMVIAVGLTLVWVDRRRLLATPRNAVSTLLALSLALVAFAYVSRPTRELILDSRVFQRSGENASSRRLVESREGTVTVASVVAQGDDRLLFNDSFQAAGTGRDYRYMKMLGHLPMLLHPRPEDVLVIAFGTGTTAGSISLHETLKSLSIVEISPEVLDLAEHFEAVNFGLPRVPPDGAELDVIVDDGRAFLRRTDRRFDVVSLEPLLPATPAAIHFYTREFFELARTRLVEGGVLCHWIPIHAQPLSSLRSILATFCAVFEDSEVYLYGSSAVLLGWNGNRPELDMNQLTDRARSPEVARDLAAAGLGRVEEILGAFVASGSSLDLENDPVLTDDHPRILYHSIEPNLERLRYHQEAVTWLVSVAQPGPPGVDGLDTRTSGSILRSQQAKAWLREADALYKGWRYRSGSSSGEPLPDRTPMLRRALEIDPFDREARELLGLPLEAEVGGIGVTTGGPSFEVVAAKVEDESASLRARATALRSLMQVEWTEETALWLQPYLEPTVAAELRIAALSVWTRIEGNERLASCLAAPQLELKQSALEVAGELSLRELTNEIAGLLLDPLAEVRLQALITLTLFGESVPNYDPDAEPEQRARAVQAWRSGRR